MEITSKSIEALSELTGGKQAEFHNLIGRDVLDKLREHFMQYDETHPNKLGGERSHFYAAAAAAAFYDTEPDAINLHMPSPVGLRQRWLGGEIRATRSKYLTIPAIADAYNRPARSFTNLKFVNFRGSDTKALVDKDDGTVLYWLKESVMQHGDPDVVPLKRIDEWANEAAMNWLSVYLRITID